MDKVLIKDLLARGIAAFMGQVGEKNRRHLRFSRGMGLPAHLPRVKPGIGFGYLIDEVSYIRMDYQEDKVLVARNSTG